MLAVQQCVLFFLVSEIFENKIPSDDLIFELWQNRDIYVAVFVIQAASVWHTAQQNPVVCSGISIISHYDY